MHEAKLRPCKRKIPMLFVWRADGTRKAISASRPHLTAPV